MQNLQTFNYDRQYQALQLVWHSNKSQKRRVHASDFRLRFCIPMQFL